MQWTGSAGTCASVRGPRRVDCVGFRPACEKASGRGDGFFSNPVGRDTVKMLQRRGFSAGYGMRLLIF